MRVVYEAKEQGIDAGEDRWAVVCAHGNILGTATLALAKSAITQIDWCSQCLVQRYHERMRKDRD